MILGSILVALSLATTPPPDSLLSADSAMALLKNGGYTMLWRHGQTDRSVSDIPGQNTERYQQRNLNDAGVALAKSVGMIFRARALPVGEVIASPMFRTMETAQYAFGRATGNPLLYTLDPSAEERALLLVVPAAGTNRIIVTHHFIIERNAPGIKPGDVGEGEAAIVKSDGKALKTIAVIKLADWARMTVDPAATKAAPETYPAPRFELTGVSPETAAKFHSGRGHVALAYVQSFNAGRDAMKAFFETNVTANPDRTIDQRLEAFSKLRTDIGGFEVITGANITDQELTVDAKTTTGKAVRITFKQEPEAPYRATSINVQYYAAHGG